MRVKQGARAKRRTRVGIVHDRKYEGEKGVRVGSVKG